jgi:hypothetical protein
MLQPSPTEHGRKPPAARAGARKRGPAHKKPTRKGQTPHQRPPQRTGGRVGTAGGGCPNFCGGLCRWDRFFGARGSASSGRARPDRRSAALGAAIKPRMAAHRPARGAVRPRGPARVVRVRSKSRLPGAPARASARYLGGRLWYSSTARRLRCPRASRGARSVCGTKKTVSIPA